MSDPFLCFEDDHLLVVDKPPGLNTHSPAPFSGEGIYDWLRHREPRWSDLAIIHRLDKETSGLIVFSKSPTGNASLTRQFTDRSRGETVSPAHRSTSSRRAVHRALNHSPRGRSLRERSAHRGPLAETRFALQERTSDGLALVAAEPLTGRTHQIRVHAADRGFPDSGRHPLWRHAVGTHLLALCALEFSPSAVG